MAVTALLAVFWAMSLSSAASQITAYSADKASPSMAERVIENTYEELMTREEQIKADSDIIVKLRYRNSKGVIVEEVKNTMSFYMERDDNTNTVLKSPEPVHVTLQLKAGAAPVSDLNVAISTELINKISIKYGSNKNLTASTPVELDVSFWDDDLAKGRETLLEGKITILTGNTPLTEIHVFCGADGFYSYYNSEFPQSFSGEPVGTSFISIGTVNLNSYKSPTFTILHMWKPMQAAETDLLKTIELDPEGSFQFLDGTYKQSVDLEESGYMQFKIHMKDSVFQKLQDEAVAGEKYIKKYIPLSDLVFKYAGASGGDDGFWIGGKGAPLPLVYLIRYSAHSNGNVSGGSSGSGSGGGSGGGSVSVIADITNYNVARDGDIGWRNQDGYWYYLNSKNKKITGWLQSPDGKWYYLDKDGKMMNGWVLVDRYWYFMREDGSMTVGWMQSSDNKWYFLNQNGSMATGWIQNPDGKWYYLLDDGAMAVSTATPDGYYVDADGSCIL